MEGDTFDRGRWAARSVGPEGEASGRCNRNFRSVRVMRSKNRANGAQSLESA